MIPGTTTEERAEEYRKRSAIFWVNKLDKPLLFMHGDEDWRVDISHAQRLLGALIEWNKKAKQEGSKCQPKDYRAFFYGHEGHGLTKSKDNVMKNVLEWFTKYHSVPK